MNIDEITQMTWELEQNSEGGREEGDPRKEITKEGLEK